MPTFEQAIRRDPVKSLDGHWHFRTDPNEDGLDDRWHESEKPWDDARSVSVPHSWQEESDLRNYNEVGWYRTTFTAPEMTNEEQSLLRFGAVDYEATVWLNGVNVGTHRDGYLPFIST